MYSVLVLSMAGVHSHVVSRRHLELCSSFVILFHIQRVTHHFRSAYGPCCPAASVITALDFVRALPSFSCIALPESESFMSVLTHWMSGMHIYVYFCIFTYIFGWAPMPPAAACCSEPPPAAVAVVNNRRLRWLSCAGNTYLRGQCVNYLAKAFAVHLKVVLPFLKLHLRLDCISGHFIAPFKCIAKGTCFFCKVLEILKQNFICDLISLIQSLWKGNSRWGSNTIHLRMKFQSNQKSGYSTALFPSASAVHQHCINRLFIISK